MTLDQLVEKLESLPHTALKELCDLTPPVALAVVIRTLQNDPTHLLRNLKDYEEFLMVNYPLVYAVATAPTVEKVSTGKILIPFTIDDVIRLRSKNEKSTPILNKCGHWWKVLQASGGGNNRKPQWYLRSLTRKQQGLKPIHGFNFDNLWLDKQDDPNFEVIQVCPFPKEFKHQEYE